MTPKSASTFALCATIGHEAISRVAPETELSDSDAESLARCASGVNPVSIKPGQVHPLGVSGPFLVAAFVPRLLGISILLSVLCERWYVLRSRSRRHFPPEDTTNTLLRIAFWLIVL